MVPVMRTAFAICRPRSWTAASLPFTDSIT
jgi:hypothetical protein